LLASLGAPLTEVSPKRNIWSYLWSQDHTLRRRCDLTVDGHFSLTYA
jgi:hypothetical protein